MERVCIAVVAAGDELWGVENIRLALSSAGYKVIAIENWGVVDILDWSRPALIIASMAGGRSEDIHLCKLLVRRGVAPVVVIGSQVEERQQLELFEAGVTDFMTHPVNLRELVARVHNILQRTKPPLHFPGAAATTISDSPIKSVQAGRNSFCKLFQVIKER